MKNVYKIGCAGLVLTILSVALIGVVGYYQQFK